MRCSVITGSGCYIPPFVKSNQDFAQAEFFLESGEPLSVKAGSIVEKFKQITGIEERRYTTADLNASDLAIQAGRLALADSGVDPESIDQLIVAHNFGNVIKDTIQTAAVPSLASQVKAGLGIRNPSCIAYDLLFGCPGWLQGMIQAHAYFQAGIARKALIIGTETLSRVIDLYDRDSMLFSDGAGAVVLESVEQQPGGPGILGFAAQTFAADEVDYINMGVSYKPDSDPRVRYMKMKGRKVYEFGIQYVPTAMKECLDRSGVDIREIRKIFIHQANEKMDQAILNRLYELYGISAPPKDVMPMCISWLGNSSVATIPTLYDLVRRDQLPPHRLDAGDLILFASVGAGMNINAVCYRC